MTILMTWLTLVTESGGLLEMEATFGPISLGSAFLCEYVYPWLLIHSWLSNLTRNDCVNVIVNVLKLYSIVKVAVNDSLYCILILQSLHYKYLLTDLWLLYCEMTV